MVRMMAIGVVVMGVGLVAATGCAQDGCETVKGKYRMELTLSAGDGCREALETIIDTEATEDENGCAQKRKETEGGDTCKEEVTSTCPDGSKSVQVMSCKDDGATCSGTVQISFADGSGCIYDVSAVRL